MLNEAQNELELSEGSDDNEGIKERTSFRPERRVAAVGRQMGRGNGYLATIGAISPFVGLFGTVWGIMNSFIGIAQTQTTNPAVVAPGIAEALLATAIGPWQRFLRSLSITYLHARLAALKRCWVMLQRRYCCCKAVTWISQRRCTSGSCRTKLRAG